MSSLTQWFCFLILATLMTLDYASAGRVHGVFRVVKGDVKVKAGSDGKIKAAKIGRKVYPQDTIITGADSRAKVVMIDKNEINVSPESSVKLEKYEYNPGKKKKDVLLDVIFGKVRSKVQQKYDGKTTKFQVKTPSAVAGVRGTDFVTSYNITTKTTKVVTFKGQVQFGLPGQNGIIRNPVLVNVGQFTVNSVDEPPEPPANLNPEALNAMDQETNAEAQPPRQPADDSTQNDSPELYDEEKDSPGGEENTMEETFVEPELIEEPILDPVQECDFCDRVTEDGTQRRLLLEVTHGP